MRERINIMVPGGFKPVHAGHIELIESYLKGDMINYAEGPMSVAQLL